MGYNRYLIRAVARDLLAASLMTRWYGMSRLVDSMIANETDLLSDDFSKGVLATKDNECMPVD